MTPENPSWTPAGNLNRQDAAYAAEVAWKAADAAYKKLEKSSAELHEQGASLGYPRAKLDQLQSLQKEVLGLLWNRADRLEGAMEDARRAAAKPSLFDKEHS